MMRTMDEILDEAFRAAIKVGPRRRSIRRQKQKAEPKPKEPGIRNARVHARMCSMLRRGYGVEDIAIRLNCAADDVRREVSILRQEGRLAGIVRPKKA